MRKPPTLELTVEQIGPETAKIWLEVNTHNRRISDRLVDVYAEAMKAGEWVLNGEPIIFDKNGRLQSGQHRLLAVIASGVPIWSVVVRGAEPDALYTLDSGRRRRMTDVLTLRGEKDVSNLAAMLVWTWRWEHNLMDRPGITPSNTHLLTMLDERPELRDYPKHVQPLKSNFKISLGLFAALFYQFDQISQAESDDFLVQLAVGENLPKESPAFAWRRWILRTMLEADKPNQATIAAITVKAWNAYRRHDSVKNFRWAGNEEFPEAI